MVLLAVSSPFMYAGLKNKNRYYELSSIDKDFEMASINDLVFVSGEIGNVSEKIESPFRSKKCSLAMWDISVLKRFGKADSSTIWSQSCIGLIGDNTMIDTGDQEIKVKDLNSTEIFNSKDKMKRSLVTDSASEFASIEMELDNQSFQRNVKPIDEPPREYRDFTEDIRFDEPNKDSYTLIGKILCKLRTPRDTTRYREKVFNTGDSITIIGKKSKNGVLFEKSKNINPLLMSKTRSQILRKYRISYVFQLYTVPILCILFSVLMGYAAYL
jgi:hypothetical protein